MFGSCSSGVEHTLGKGEVDGSIPSMSSILRRRRAMLAFFVSALRWFGGESKGCQAEVSPLLWRPLLRRRLLARMTIQASSSIGRAAVSKTAGWGFDSLLACQLKLLA